MSSTTRSSVPWRTDQNYSTALSYIADPQSTLPRAFFLLSTPHLITLLSVRRKELSFLFCDVRIGRGGRFWCFFPGKIHPDTISSSPTTVRSEHTGNRSII